MRAIRNTFELRFCMTLVLVGVYMCQNVEAQSNDEQALTCPLSLSDEVDPSDCGIDAVLTPPANIRRHMALFCDKLYAALKRHIDDDVIPGYRATTKSPAYDAHQSFLAAQAVSTALDRYLNSLSAELPHVFYVSERTPTRFVTQRIEFAPYKVTHRTTYQTNPQEDDKPKQCAAYNDIVTAQAKHFFAKDVQTWLADHWQAECYKAPIDE